MVDMPKEKNSTGLYEAAIGQKNQAYYLDRFEQFDKNRYGFHASWNWAALFGAGVWALYRKMYGWFFATWAFGIILNMVMKLNPPPVVGLLYLAPWFCFAIFGNSLYYRKVIAQIASAQKSNADERKVIRRLNGSGGVHTWVLYVVGAIPVIGIVAAIAIPAYENTAKTKFDASTAKLVDATQTSSGTDWANGTITPPPQPSATSQKSHINAFPNQPLKVNPFDQFDEKPSQGQSAEYLTKRKLIFQKILQKEILQINGSSSLTAPTNLAIWSNANSLDLERNQTPWRMSRTQFSTHISNNTLNTISVIGFDFKDGTCSDGTKSNRFFVSLSQPIPSSSTAVVNFIVPDFFAQSEKNFCLDIVSAWN